MEEQLLNATKLKTRCYQMQNADAYNLPTLGIYNEGPLKIIKEGPKREMSMKVSIFKLGYFLSLGENIDSRVS